MNSAVNVCVTWTVVEAVAIMRFATVTAIRRPVANVCAISPVVDPVLRAPFATMCQVRPAVASVCVMTTAVASVLRVQDAAVMAVPIHRPVGNVSVTSVVAVPAPAVSVVMIMNSVAR